MKARVVCVMVLGAVGFAGCAMFGAWQSIPAPGGCESCHVAAINADWQVAVRPVQLTREDGTPPWQSEGSVLPPPESPLGQKMLEDESCFRCHREPNAQHREYRGRYHHQ